MPAFHYYSSLARRIKPTVDFTSFLTPPPPGPGNLWFVRDIGCNVKCPPAPTINFLGTGGGGGRNLKGSEIDSIFRGHL